MQQPYYGGASADPAYGKFATSGCLAQSCVPQSMVQRQPVQFAMQPARALQPVSTTQQPQPVGSPGSEVEEILAKVAARQASPTNRDLAYHSFLQLLLGLGMFENLPLDGSGILRVNMPFCGAFSEAPMLLPFLVERVSRLGARCRGISVWGSDLEALPLMWQTYQEWSKRNLGDRVQLMLSQQDLEKETLPQAGLIIAVHPRATLFGPWYGILAHVFQSRVQGGRCIVATFFEWEAQAVEKIYRSLGVQVEIRQNPFYSSYAPDAEATPLRYAVIVGQ